MVELNWITVNLLLPLLSCLHQGRLEDVIFSKMFEFAEIPEDMESLFHGTKPSLISCGIHCLNFSSALTFIACSDSNNTTDCYCTAVTDFSTSRDQACSVFKKQMCKNGGYYDGKLCKCVEGFIGLLCEIDVNSSSCLEEYVRIIDPMDMAALEDVRNAKGTLKQKVHIDDHDVIYDIIFTTTSYGGVVESIEHLKVDILNRSNLDVHRLHRAFDISNNMVALSLGYGSERSNEITEETNNIQLKGFIGERMLSTNSLCLEVVNSQIIYGSYLDCFLGVLKGFVPTFAEESILRTVDSAGLYNGDIYFKFMPKMVRYSTMMSFANNPAISGNFKITSRGAGKRINWNIKTNKLKLAQNFTTKNYSVYLDKSWYHAYSNDEFGNSTHGFLAYLHEAVVSGKRVRIAVEDTVYSVSNIHVNQDITVCVTDEYDTEAWTQNRPVQIRQEVSTSGDYRNCSFELESDLGTSSSSGLKSVTWFIENRCWNEIIKFGSDKQIVSGTIRELFEVASTGRSLRIVVAYSSTVLEIIGVNIVHLFNVSLVVLDSGSFGIIAPKTGSSSNCLQKSYSLYSDGVLEYSKWSAGRNSPVLRTFVNSYYYIQVLIEN